MVGIDDLKVVSNLDNFVILSFSKNHLGQNGKEDVMGLNWPRGRNSSSALDLIERSGMRWLKCPSPAGGTGRAAHMSGCPNLSAKIMSRWAEAK